MKLGPEIDGMLGRTIAHPDVLEHLLCFQIQFASITPNRYFRSLSEGRMSRAYNSIGTINKQKVRPFYEESANIEVRGHNVTR
jgi:hypothetical protein